MAKSRSQCQVEAEARGLMPGTPSFEDYVQNCIAGGGTEQPPKTGENPCEHGGYLGRQVEKARGVYGLLEKCKDGYKPKKAADGRIWCCKEVETPGKDEDGTTTGEGCEGGYKLSEKPVMPTGGKIWTDEIIKAEHGFFRVPTSSAHWLYKDGKWYQREDIVKAIQAGTLDSLTGQEGGMCAKGYQPKTINGETWCCPTEKLGIATAGETVAGTEFKWSPELQEAIRSLLGRFEELLDRPMGLTPTERQAIVNRALQGLRAGERGRIQSERDWLSRMGLGGQPFEAERIGEIKRQTRVGEADIRSTLAIDEIDKALQSLLGTTGAASEVLNILMATEQLPEVLSAGRRGESMDYQRMILDYLAMLMGGQSNTYWDAILSRLLENKESGGIWDWLPWLPYLTG